MLVKLGQIEFLFDEVEIPRSSNIFSLLLFGARIWQNKDIPKKVSQIPMFQAINLNLYSLFLFN